MGRRRHQQKRLCKLLGFSQTTNVGECTDFGSSPDIFCAPDAFAHSSYTSDTSYSPGLLLLSKDSRTHAYTAQHSHAVTRHLASPVKQAVAK